VHGERVFLISAKSNTGHPTSNIWRSATMDNPKVGPRGCDVAQKNQYDMIKIHDFIIETLIFMFRFALNDYWEFLRCPFSRFETAPVYRSASFCVGIA